jgi:hypothetical protein
MSQKLDIAKYLLEKHNARVDTKDYDGFSPHQLALSPGGPFMNQVTTLIKDHVTKQAEAEKKAEKHECSRCGKFESPKLKLSKCARCKRVQFCSKDCQVANWKQHKVICKKLAADPVKGVLLEKPPPDDRCSITLNWKSGKQNSPGSFRKPDNVAVGKRFFIKVQGNSGSAPLLIYDESRQFECMYSSGLRGFHEMLEKVKADKASQGRKTYMRASFDAAGNCTVYPGSATIKTW